MTKNIYGIGLILAVVYIASPVSSNAQTGDDALVKQASQDQSTVVHVDHAVAATAQSMAFIDPKTGQLTSRPSTPIQNQAALQNQAARQAQANLPPVQYTTYADGTVGANLNGRFRTQLMVTVDCDGNIKTQHANELAPPTEKCEADK